METYKRDDPPIIPRTVAVCPICDADIFIEEITEWHPDDGTVAKGGVIVNCTTEPHIEADNFGEWMDWHWSMPYVDWLPVCYIVERWLNKNYRIAEDDR